MLEAPVLKRILDINKLLGKLVQLEVGIGILVDLKPRSVDRIIGFIRLAEIPFELFSIDRKTGVIQLAQDHVVKTRLVQDLFEPCVDVRVMPMHFDQLAVLVAQEEFHLPVRVRLES